MPQALLILGAVTVAAWALRQGGEAIDDAGSGVLKLAAAAAIGFYVAKRVNL